MKTVAIKCHKKAFTQAVELLIIAGTIGLVADIIWVFKDALQLQYNWFYLIGSMLTMATIMTVYAGVVVHRENVSNSIKELQAEAKRVRETKARARKQHNKE